MLQAEQGFGIFGDEDEDDYDEEEDEVEGGRFGGFGRAGADEDEDEEEGFGIEFGKPKKATGKAAGAKAAGAKAGGRKQREQEEQFERERGADGAGGERELPVNFCRVDPVSTHPQPPLTKPLFPGLYFRGQVFVSFAAGDRVSLALPQTRPDKLAFPAFTKATRACMATTEVGVGSVPPACKPITADSGRII